MDENSNEYQTINSLLGRFNDDLRDVMSLIENGIVKSYPTPVVNIDYFISAILTLRESNAYKLLNANMSSYNFGQITIAYETQIAQRALSIVKPGRELRLDSKFLMYIENAEKIRDDIGDKGPIGSEHVLLAILNDGDQSNKAKIVFNRVGITFNFILDKISEQRNNTMLNAPNEMPIEMKGDDGETFTGKLIPIDGGYEIMVPINAQNQEELNRKLEQVKKQSSQMFEKMKAQKQAKDGAVAQYCINVSEQASEGKIDRLIGRDNELDEIIRILGRRRKNNAVIVGGEGVGKTTIAENLAYRILDGRVPPFLKDKTVISLDMTALIAGTTLRGMFEERTKNLIDEIKSSKKYILLIDNIGSVLGHKNSNNDYDISSMLSIALENGDLQVVGTADFKTFRSTFDKDPSLSRRFQKMVIEAPTTKESLDIMFGVKGYYEGFHNVQYTDAAIEACVNLADKYITERNLPDSAIDILDEAGSLVGNNQPEDQRSVDIKRRIANLRAEIKEHKNKEEYNEIDRLEKMERELLMEQSRITKVIVKDRIKNPPVIDEGVILELISKKTGIPMTNLSANDKQRLVSMDKRLKDEVIGQDEAIDTITRSLKRNRIGLRSGGCMFSCLAIGRTGIGKTLIAKKLAKEMFGSESNLIRFDMSEYPDKSAVNKLIGSNPGYIGYEEGGQLTEAIKNHKHCVLLIDEIEKADPEVYNIFLQVLDEGFLTDNSGMKVDFKNIIIIFTSNVGTKAASDFSKGIGFNDNEDANSKRILEKQLKNRFPPEFINRLDTVIYFNNLTDENLSDIVRLEMGKMISNINEIGYNATYDDSVVEHILSIVKNEKEYGARPILRTIRTEIEDKITDKLLENDYESGYVFTINFDTEEQQVKVS